MPMHEDFERVLERMRRQYGERRGEEVFRAWIGKNGLDETKPLAPQLKEKERLFEFAVLSKISESFLEKPLRIRGTAVKAGESRNRNIYLEDELERAAPSLVGKPLYIEHVEADKAVGRVTAAWWDPLEAAIKYEAEVHDEEIAEKIRRGLIQHVSIAADYQRLDRVDGYVPQGLNFRHLALVAVPGVPDANVEVVERLGRLIEESRGIEIEEREWDTAYQNELPDSAFLWIHPDYKSGKSKDKSLRKLPVYDKNGRLDRAHVIAAMQAVLGARGGVDIPEADKREVYKKLVRLYKELGMEPPEWHEALEKEPNEKNGSEVKKEMVEEKKEEAKIEEKKAEEKIVEKVVEKPVMPKEVEEKLKAIEEKLAELSKEGKGVWPPRKPKVDYRAVIAESFRKYKDGKLVKQDLAKKVITPDGIVAEAAYDTAAAGSAIPEIWAREVAKLLPTKATLQNVVRWFDALRGKPGDTLHIPTLSRVSFGSASEGTGATAQAPTTSSVNITLTERIAEIDINRQVMEDAVPELIDAINERIAEAYEYDFDGRVLSILNSPGVAIGGTLSESGKMAGTVIAKACGSMRAGTYEPKWLIIHPVQEASLLQDPQFVNAATYGNRDVIQSGRVWQYLGLNILVSPQVDSTGGTYRAYLLSEDALAFAGKRDLTIDTDYNVQKRQNIIVATARYGGTVLHPKGIWEIRTVNG